MKKKILITGATSGIGLSAAKYLLEAGYDVFITGRSADHLKSAQVALNHSASSYLADSSSLADIDRMVADIEQSHGKLDGVFLNAGVFQPASFANSTEKLFDETFNINFKGAFFTLQKILPLLNNPASIVLNTSLVVQKAFTNASAYTASKAALDSLAGVLNLELAERGVRINTISPGVTRTPIQEKSGMSASDIEGLQQFGIDTALGRLIQSDDIAPAIEFLLSDKSIAMRGVRLDVNGGAAL